MMFLIRTAFWLGVVIMLIPVDDKAADGPATAGVETIGALEAAGAAQEAIADLGGFCERNPAACDVGGRIATTFALKARTGAASSRTSSTISSPARRCRPTSAAAP